METYITQKRCKCGTLLEVRYELNEPKEMGIEVVDYSCGLRGRANAWPNSVRCSGCSKIHRLEFFKRVSS